MIGFAALAIGRRDVCGVPVRLWSAFSAFSALRATALALLPVLCMGLVPVQASASVFGLSTLFLNDGAISASGTRSDEFVVDSTVGVARIFVQFDATMSDVTLSLLKQPAGVDAGVVFSCQAGGDFVSCTGVLDDASIARLGTGTYEVQLSNATADAIGASVTVFATTKDSVSGGPYVVSIGTSTGDDVVRYPQPIVLSVVVARELPLTGLAVVSRVVDPVGIEQRVDLNDDGVGADRYASDGLYSAWVPYSVSGPHIVHVQVDNRDGDAVYTDAALSMAPPELDGTVTSPVFSGERFMRVVTRQIVVEGVMPDDHPDDPTLGDSCTHVSPDNSAIHGRFDGPGDVDCFFIVPPLATIDPLIVRIFNRALGADPRFAVYDAGGRTLVAEVDEVDEIDLAVATASEGAFSALSALSVVIAGADVDPAGLVLAVGDADETGSGGTYSVSAGEALGSDPL